MRLHFLSGLCLLLPLSIFSQKPVPDSGLEMGQKAPVPTEVRGKERVDLTTNLPVVLYETNVRVTSGNNEEKARMALNRLGTTLGLTTADLDNLEVYFQREGLAGTTVRLQQSWQGVPVFGGTVAVTFRPDGKVIMVGNDFVKGVNLMNVRPSISADQAKITALEYLNPRGAITDQYEELIILNTDDGAKLAYQISFVSMEPMGQWEVFVDASNAELLRVSDVAAYHNERKHAEHIPLPMMVDGVGNVFDPDPLSTANATYGDAGYTDNSDNTTPELINEQVQVTLPGITEEGGMFFLKGVYCEITDEESPNRGVFEQATPEWLFNRDDNAFEAANVYYHIDASMRYLNETLGVAVMPTDYSTGVRCDPSGLNGADNSHYIGSSQRLAWGDGGVDDAEDSDVIHHELGHGLHDWITGGGLSQNQGLSEGCGDYWAASYNRFLGDWTSGDAQYNWVFNWDGHNQFWGGRSCGVSTTWSPSLSGSIHTQGQVWSTSMMLVWDAIGRNKADKIFWEGIAMTNGSANQNDAANAVYQAALTCPGFTQADALAVHTILTDRGYILPGFTLPVEWLSLSATPGPKSVFIEWSAVEMNNDHYLIERSVDNGRSFVSIGRVNTTPGEAEAHAYAFEDQHPVNGENSYRIRQVDADGSFSFSNVVAATFTGASAAAILPNPTDGLLQIIPANNVEAPIDISIMDLAGRKLLEHRGVLPGDNFSIASLKPGVYLVQYNDGATLVTHRVVRR